MSLLKTEALKKDLNASINAATMSKDDGQNLSNWTVRLERY